MLIQCKKCKKTYWAPIEDADIKPKYFRCSYCGNEFDYSETQNITLPENKKQEHDAFTPVISRKPIYRQLSMWICLIGLCISFFFFGKYGMELFLQDKPSFQKQIPSHQRREFHPRNPIVLKNTNFEIISTPTPVIVVRGILENQSGQKVPMPLVNFILYDMNDQVVQHHYISTQKQTINPHEDLLFKTEIIPIVIPIKTIDIKLKNPV